ncbi:MAG: flavodoxin domain-containing protein [Flavobacteriaceae bacterium]|nr:flavodoxin domain-containing protein [Flavobacteriaceae bacterium]
MKGAIIFSTKYGSTAQYANWIAEATGLPVFNIKDSKIDLSMYDFLVLGSPVIYYKLTIHKWVKKHLAVLEQKPIIFFSVSGAPAGPKLDEWIAKSLPKNFILKMKHVVLRGRQRPEELTLFDRMMMKIGGFFNKDPQARKEELQGFDLMDKSSIEPILEMVREL